LYLTPPLLHLTSLAALLHPSSLLLLAMLLLLLLPSMCSSTERSAG
jgi:hypothetical protein